MWSSGEKLFQREERGRAKALTGMFEGERGGPRGRARKDEWEMRSRRQRVSLGRLGGSLQWPWSLLSVQWEALTETPHVTPAFPQ